MRGPRQEAPQGGAGPIGAPPATFAVMVRENPLESHYRARYYDQTAGRFVSEDPVGFKAGANFYRFTRNNPVNLIDPRGLYELKGFSPTQAAQMTIAIGKLVAKLNTSCCVDPDVRRRILNHLQPFNYGHGVTFTFYNKIINNGKSVSAQTTSLVDDIDISEEALSGLDACPLEGIILHELVHTTWHNVGLAFKDQLYGTDHAEVDAHAKSAACYGEGCQKPPKP